jgi:hypothetical protein
MASHRNGPTAATDSKDDDAEDDVDNPNVKYNRRRKRRLRPSSTWLSSPSHSAIPLLSIVPVVVGLSIIFGSLLAVWRYSALQLETKAHQEQMERRGRADRMLAERQFETEHAAVYGKEFRQDRKLEHAFSEERNHRKETGALTLVRKILHEWLQDVDKEILHNVRYGGPRWIRPYLLPPMPDSPEDNRLAEKIHWRRPRNDGEQNSIGFFSVDRMETRMAWRDEFDAMSPQEQQRGPPVDYTQADKYRYPNLLVTTPEIGTYPPLSSLEEIMRMWHQDEDFIGVFEETLMHFNYSVPAELAAATLFRDSEVPFKLYDVPEIVQVGTRWTDQYLAQHFSSHSGVHRDENGNVLASGIAQESPNNYFAFFIPKLWDVDSMGLPPTRNNDWTFSEWAKHAHYADATSLAADQPHFYWQAGVPPEERFREPDTWTFITRDLPLMSSTNATFLTFNPMEQKGIQCRFGERGVVAATHYDGGRNMVAMITGAKRYILSPPNQCSKLGIFTSKKSPIYRHSLLNFGHIKHLNNDKSSTKADGMSPEERAWLERASVSQAVQTVLKAGEVLYIPSHWFHYIISLQKSAQCNVRSGIDKVGTTAFGGFSEVANCKE